MNETAFFQAINQQALVLTANRRLSRACHLRYQHYQQQQNLQFWPSATILPFNSWLLECWRQLPISMSQQLLNDQQALILWQKIISDDQTTQSPHIVHTIAKLAGQAWQQCCLWNVAINETDIPLNEDQQAFQRWAKQYRLYCQQQQLIDAASLHQPLLAAFAKNQIPLPRQIILHGFDQLNPRDQLIIDHLATLGIVIDYFDFQKNCQPPQTVAFDDSATQIKTMAKWAEQCANNGETVACVFPQLSSQRQIIERIFQQQLAGSGQHYNISAGSPLLDSPVIHAALQILSLNNQPLELETFSALLRSPYLGLAESEQTQRFKIDSMLREQGEAFIDLSDVMQILKNNNLCDDLLTRLQNYKNLLTKEVKPLSDWVEHFNQLLRVMGWPGQRPLISEEYQTVQRFLAIFDEFIQLELIIEKCNYQQALYCLKQTVSNTILQIQTETSPIQILGLLEAAGLNFDRLWVADLDDQQWPAPAKSNPLIPLALQKSLAMPHASAERELQFSTQIMQRFSSSCHHIYYSYVKSQGAQTVQASPLIKSFHEINSSDILTIPLLDPYKKLFALRDVESIIDYQAPELFATEKIGGGTFIIKEQAACPFRAFARFRLNAETIEQTQTGLSGKERGIIVHKILQTIWQQLGDQATLLAQSELQLKKIVTTAIVNALQPLAKQRKFTLNNAFIALETQRLGQLIRRWLELEKSRPAFIVVAQETMQHINFGALDISMRVDRIDKSSNGETFIIDYKTGKTNIADWFDIRLNEPQLPLYSLAYDAVDGLLFAQIASDNICFKGISEQAADINGVKTIEELKKEDIPDWQTLRQQWRDNITQLATQFSQGYAVVDPKNPAATCQYCELQGLCRVKETVNTGLFENYENNE